MTWPTVLLMVVAGAVALFVVDRLLRKAEDRGWIYYRTKKAASGSLTAAAFGPAFDVLQPTRQVIVDERQHQELMREQAGIDDDHEPE